jgi:hypothetical protein
MSLLLQAVEVCDLTAVKELVDAESLRGKNKVGVRRALSTLIPTLRESGPIRYLLFIVTHHSYKVDPPCVSHGEFDCHAQPNRYLRQMNQSHIVYHNDFNI